MKPHKKIEALVDRLLLEKEKMDCAHVKKAAVHGCSCRRCKTARGIR